MRSRRRRDGIVALAVVLSACGDNLVPQAADPRSGERLKLEHLVYADGTQQLVAGAFFDGERAEECRPLQWSDGFVYCTPPATPTVYRDAACTEDVATAPGYAMHTFALAGRALPSRMYEVGAAIAGVPVFAVRAFDGACLPFDVQAATLYALGAEVPRDRLVAIARTEVGDGRLGVLVDRSADGMQVAAGVTDREHHFECVLANPGRGEASCAPDDAADAVFFHDAACTEPELAVSRGKEPPARAVVTGPDGCQTFHARAIEVGPVPLFRRTPNGCIDGTVSGDRTFLLDAPLALASVPRTPTATGSRFAAYQLGDLAVADPFLHDTAIATDCAPGELLGTRCLPPAAPAIPLFRDDLCVEPTLAALVATSPCTTPVTFARREADFFAITTPSLGLFELTTGDRCVPYIPVAGFAVFEVSPVPPTVFAAATLVADP